MHIFSLIGTSGRVKYMLYSEKLFFFNSFQGFMESKSYIKYDAFSHKIEGKILFFRYKNM